jgi:hypothetical protein
MRLVGAPGAGAGHAGGSKDAAWAESKSWYDLINNEEVSVPALRALRAGVVREALDPSAEVAVFHDITELDFTWHASKQQRMEIGDHKGRGYEYHPCVAWDPRAKRFLGVLHDTVISESGPDDADMMDYHGDPLLAHWHEAERDKLRSNHRHQLATHIRGLAVLAPGQPMVHVADREFDDIPAMAAARLARATPRQARQAGHDFVIRELDPPPGVDPLRWLLFTSLPVDTIEQQAWVGALYEQRWRIEEYFKLLKSGFRIEYTHFTEPEQIAKMLVFYRWPPWPC